MISVPFQSRSMQPSRPSIFHPPFKRGHPAAADAENMKKFVPEGFGFRVFRVFAARPLIGRCLGSVFVLTRMDCSAIIHVIFKR
jgi:hypothetical protein